MQVAAFQQQFPQAHRGIIRVRQERVFDDDGGTATRLQHLDQVLEEQKSRLAGADREILLHLFPFLAPKGRICQHHLEPILVLNVADVFSEGVRVNDVRGLDAMQNHVHDRNDVGQALLLLPVEGAFLKDA